MGSPCSSAPPPGGGAKAAPTTGAPHRRRRTVRAAGKAELPGQLSEAALSGVVMHTSGAGRGAIEQSSRRARRFETDARPNGRGARSTASACRRKRRDPRSCEKTAPCRSARHRRVADMKLPSRRASNCRRSGRSAEMVGPAASSRGEDWFRHANDRAIAATSAAGVAAARAVGGELGARSSIAKRVDGDAERPRRAAVDGMNAGRPTASRAVGEGLRTSDSRLERRWTIWSHSAPPLDRTCAGKRLTGLAARIGLQRPPRAAIALRAAQTARHQDARLRSASGAASQHTVHHSPTAGWRECRAWPCSPCARIGIVSQVWASFARHSSTVCANGGRIDEHFGEHPVEPVEQRMASFVEQVQRSSHWRGPGPMVRHHLSSFRA